MRNYLCIVSLILTSGIAGCADPKSTPGQPATSQLTSEDGEADQKGPEPEGAVSSSSQSATAAGIGKPAAKFEGLVGIDDQKHSLEQYADAKAVAIVFTCNHCPVAIAYEERLVALHNDYAEKGVQLLAINVNNLEQDKLPAMKVRAEERGFEFPYLYDPTQQVGRDYQATVTPHAFLLNSDRELAYVGAIDDNQDPASVEKHYLRDAIDAVLAGSAPAIAAVKPVGCGIQYE